MFAVYILMTFIVASWYTFIEHLNSLLPLSSLSLHLSLELDVSIHLFCGHRKITILEDME